MKISPFQQSLIIGAAIFVAIIGAFYQFMLKPENAQIVQLNGTLITKKKALDDAKKTMAKYVEFKKHSDSVQRELEWIQNRIPQKVDNGQLMENLNFLQSRSGIILTSFQMRGNVNKRDSYTEIPMNLKFNTNYAGFLNFLYQTTVSPLLLTVNDITVSPDTQSHDPNQTDITLSVELSLNGVQANGSPVKGKRK
ncbi:MAG: type 4a pilus biogenesis protein PilO [bacterium]